MDPRVSIIVPNFDNGRSSSMDGATDLLGDLLASLATTLAEDPTPLEILVADDGSTDDSLETARAWSRKRRPDGSPFLRLIEREHCGVLSSVLNALMAETRGELIFRLDGDVVMHTPRWVERLVRRFDEGGEDLGVVGAVQLLPSGLVHCYGDVVAHPRGFHHLMQGARPEEVREPVEVDDVMGCFHCMRRATWEDVGPYDETILRGQTNDHCLRARSRSWRLVQVPDVRFTHRHALRRRRANVADRDESIEAALARFRAKWGFDRLAPDLRRVRERWGGTPLCWNRRVWSKAEAPCATEPPPLEASPWGRAASDPAAQQALAADVAWSDGVLAATGANGLVACVALDAGLRAHCLARRGRSVVAIERDPGLARLGATAGDRPAPTGTSGSCLTLGPDDRFPLNDGIAGAVVLLGAMERFWNPVGLLEEAFRVLAPKGLLLIRSAARPTIADPADLAPRDDAPDAPHRFRAHELNMLLRHVGLFDPMTLADPRGPGALTFIGRRAPQRRGFGGVTTRMEIVAAEA